jgi:hypothetical protein
MSEPIEPGPETGEGATTGEGGTPEQEDGEAQRLLGQMAGQDPEELQRQVEHWKAQSRKWESRAGENKGAAEKLREIEDANKTELQKATEARDEALRHADEVTASHNRVMAAAAFDLPADIVDYLGSGTAEEVTARAENLSTIIQTRAEEIAQEIMSRNGYPSVASGMRPIESLRAGSQPTGATPPQSKDDFLRHLFTGGGGE